MEFIYIYFCSASSFDYAYDSVSFFMEHPFVVNLYCVSSVGRFLLFWASLKNTHRF